MRRPRFSWSRAWFTDPRNRLSYGGYSIGAIAETSGGWMFLVAVDPQWTPPALAKRLPDMVGVARYATPAEARAALEAFVRPLLRGVQMEVA